MKRSVKLGILVVTICLIAGAFLALSAAPGKSRKASVLNLPAKPPALIFNKALKSTSVVVGEADITIPSGFTNIDSPLGFTCPGPTTCTVAAEMNVQLGENTISGNGWALLGMLDGSYMDGGPYVGELLTDGRFSAAHWTATLGGVTPGHHTLQSQVYTDDGAFLANYELVYRLYKP